MDIDRTSRHILVKMDQIGGETTAAELRDSLGLDANQSIHYRMDNKLIPEGLVTEGDRREQPGSRKPARVYELTVSGREWVEKNGHRVTLTDLDEAGEEIQRISERIQSLSEDVHNLKQWRQSQSGQTGGMSNRLSDIGDRVETLEGQMSKHERRDYSSIWDRIHDLDEDTDRLSKTLDEHAATTDEIKQVNKDVQNISNQLDSLESHLDDLQASHNDWADWGNQIDQRVEKLEQHASQSFFGRLRWLLFG